MQSQGALLASALKEFIQKDAARFPSSVILDPGVRRRFHWPGDPITHKYNVCASQFLEATTIHADGVDFAVAVAVTDFGVFGRCESLWNEARGENLEEMLGALRTGMEPMLQRLRAISATLGLSGLSRQPIKTLAPIDLLKLLYCPDRDAAMEAQGAIESQASSHPFFDAMAAILWDKVHPLRRSPQWCVLDMLEDFPAFAKTPEQQKEAVDAIKALMWDARDDYCRTIYKAGVVLGGHVCTEDSADALIDCIAAPSRIARRSAMHAVFHLAEWMPHHRQRVVAALKEQAAKEPEPLLAAFAQSMAKDIAQEAHDHMTEPVFPEEAAL